MTCEQTIQKKTTPHPIQDQEGGGYQEGTQHMAVRNVSTGHIIPPMGEARQTQPQWVAPTLKHNVLH